MPLSKYCPVSPEHDAGEWRPPYVMRGVALCSPLDFPVLREYAEVLGGTTKAGDDTYEYPIRIYCCDVDRLRRGIYAGLFMFNVKREKKREK